MKIANMILGLLYLILVLFDILFYPDIAFQYASQGMNVWFTKLIPTLFPFMVLSKLIIKTNLSDKMMVFLNPILRPIFRVKNEALFVIVIGFTCGLPMGAKVTEDLMKEGRLSSNEGQWLLCFTNLLGPSYFLGYLLPMLQLKSKIVPVIGMYGIAFLYGILLRYTVYRKKILYTKSKAIHNRISMKDFPLYLEDALTQSLIKIAMLGGYMMFFNLLCLPLHILVGEKPIYAITFLEISNGLNLMKDQNRLFSLSMAVFGGCCCLMQTYSCIKDTELSIVKYCIYKALLTILSTIFFVFFLYE